ncbi:hypothetical protein CYMTET_5433 [Cymbomonas tetramitiformis]|uniref:Uncharacterized protein n=1 Tax=Cymbomonas tetramitiformis TaxID=36881 RepID=A0AAE0GZF7_9CHLO|nr:hypothetical protein CYMTET_5433 [Cymbomonas tetramitiformis]
MRSVKSREGARHGDLASRRAVTLYLAAPLQTVLERVREEYPEVIVFAYLDDGFLVGPPIAAARAYIEEAAAIGLDIQPAKSAAYSPEGGIGEFVEEKAEMMQEAAEEHARRMREALRDLLPSGGLAWHSSEFATLHRWFLLAAGGSAQDLVACLLEVSCSASLVAVTSGLLVAKGLSGLEGSPVYDPALAWVQLAHAFALSVLKSSVSLAAGTWAKPLSRRVPLLLLGWDAAGCFELYSDLIAAQQLILPSAMAASAMAATAAFLTW